MIIYYLDSILKTTKKTKNCKASTMLTVCVKIYFSKYINCVSYVKSYMYSTKALKIKLDKLATCDFM